MKGEPIASMEVAPEELSSSLCAVRLCVPETQERMERSLSKLGQLTPVQAWRVGDALELFDGVKRWRAARALSWKTLRVEVHALDATGAKVRLLSCNAASGLSELEVAWVVRSLYREDGLSQPQIARLLSRDKSWVSRKLTLAEGLCDELTAQVRLGLSKASRGLLGSFAVKSRASQLIGASSNQLRSRREATGRHPVHLGPPHSPHNRFSRLPSPADPHPRLPTQRGGRETVLLRGPTVPGRGFSAEFDVSPRQEVTTKVSAHAWLAILVALLSSLCRQRGPSRSYEVLNFPIGGGRGVHPRHDEKRLLKQGILPIRLVGDHNLTVLRSARLNLVQELRELVDFLPSSKDAQHQGERRLRGH